MRPVDAARRLRVTVPIVLATVAIDALAKHLARTTLMEPHTHRVIGDWLRLRTTFNAGGTLGLGASLSHPARFTAFELGAAMLLGLITTWTLTAPRISMRQLVACALLVGGGSANLLDRALNGGRVTDFLDIGAGTLRTGWINLADVGITAAIALLLIEGWRAWRNH